MHEAEKVLSLEQSNDYRLRLADVCIRDGSGWTAFATASQRAEAFLRTIGKWQDQSTKVSSTSGISVFRIKQKTVVQNERLKAENAKLRNALKVILDQSDYSSGNCSPTSMVAAVLEKSVIDHARAALKE
jgi:hypothetical protein